MGNTNSDDCPEVGIRAAYIEEQAAAYRAIHGALSVPDVATVKGWVTDALQAVKTAQLTMIADCSRDNGLGALYKDHLAAVERLEKEKETK